ncbi:hypothetical protein V494_00149 [Pseudogymnoascus sp. VKM F-4513 (FW-928)]|nr:hypothetical protein V494_00149 [Pseudogymnoascus sp. VKM F-4513 (FW-928)]
MFLGGLAVVALLSSALSHHLGTSYKHRHDDRSVDPGCTSPSSSDTGTVTTTLAPTPTTTVNDATKSTPSASTTASDDTMSPTKTTGTSVSSTGYASALCSSSPITGCAKSRYIIAQSSLSSGNNCFSQCFQNSICTGYMVGKDTDGHYREPRPSFSAEIGQCRTWDRTYLAASRPNSGYSEIYDHVVAVAPDCGGRQFEEDRIKFLTTINDEAKVQRSTRSLVLGKAKVMSYEDLEEARAKRAEKEAAKEAKGKGKRGRKCKSATSEVDEASMGNARCGRKRKSAMPEADATEPKVKEACTSNAPESARGSMAQMW